MADAASLKDVGNAKFKAGEFAAAIDAYTRSLEQDSQQHLCYSNRSAAYLKLGGSAEEALRDAERCVELMPGFAKGYSRQAAALQDLKRWDDAIAACDRGLAATDDAALKKMRSEVKCRHFQDRLQGTWHGMVHEALGGYEQEMEFVDESMVRVEVLGRSIMGKYWVDCGPEPHHLSIQVPMQDVPPPGMPPPPPVPYIARIDGEGLHICCPFMRMERPTSFDGPGYCLMTAGAMAQTEISDVTSLSREEQLLECTKALTDTLPGRRLEEVQQSDTEESTKEKVMAQVRFESSMFAVQRRFGEDLMKEVLGATKPGADEPAALAGTAELKGLKEKLMVCGLLDDEGGEPNPLAPAPTPPPVPPQDDGKKEDVAASASGQPPAEPEEETTAAGDIGAIEIAGALALCAAVAAVVFTLWRRSKKS